jgi:hypothetical protein
MANQIVSTNLNLDAASISGLANGEDITVDTNAILTINSDNRWSQQAAVIGNITASAASGGQVQVDGRDVWWIPFDAPSGNVPALGTVGVQNCTGGTSLATGEFLGIWSAMATAPVAAAAAIPSAGFIKFRSKVGTFVDNEVITLPGGATVTVNSTTGGKRGWLHIVGEQSTTINIPRLGKFQVTGDWFELGTTNGADDQTFDIPVLDHIPAIQVETAVGSGVYEWWLNGGRRWGTTTQYIPTDLRGKYFGQYVSGSGTNTTSTTALGSYTGLSTTNASAVITGFTNTAELSVGQPVWLSAGFTDGTALYIVSIVANTSITVNVNSNQTGASRTMDALTKTITLARRVSRSCGYKPVTGLRVRMPNVILSTAGATPNFSGNVLLATVANRWDFTTTSAGEIDLDKVCSNIYLSFTAAFRVSITESCVQDVLVSNVGATTVIDDVGMTPDALRAAVLLTGTNLFSGITLNKLRLARFLDGNGSTVLSLTDADGVDFTDCQSEIFGSTTATTRSNATCATCVLTRVSNGTITRHSTIGGRLSIVQSQNLILSDTRFADTLNGTTQTTNPLVGAFDVNTTSINILIEGFSNFQSIANMHPYTAILLATAGCLDIKLRNIGTPAAPYDCGSANATGLGVSCSVTKGLELKRVYLQNVRTAPLSFANTVQDVVVDNVWGDGADAQAIAAVNCLVRGARYTNSVTGQTSVYGRHWEDAFTSTTAGRLVIAMNEPLAATADQAVITSGAPQFTSAGTINMPTVGDQIVWEMPYFAIGHTALANIAPTVTGTNTGNFTLTYQIDVGSGYNGTWLALTAGNLSSHAIPAFVNLYNQGGFRLKVRATVATGSVTNALTYIRIDTVTTSTEQRRQYPFYTPDVGYSGTLSGSRLAIYVDSTNDLAKTATDDAGSTIAATPWDASYSAVLRLRKAGYEPIENTITIGEAGSILLAEQVDYATVADTDPGALGITVTNHGAAPVTWNAKDFSITITTTNDALTAAQVVNYINYNIAQFATFNGFSGFAWPEMVTPDASNFQTERGRLIGSAGAALKGVRVVRNDGTTPVPGFNRFQADDGSYYTPPVLTTITVTGLQANTEVRAYVDSGGNNGSVVDGVENSGASFSFSVLSGTVINIMVNHLNYLPADVWQFTVPSENTSIPISQVIDRQYANL